MCEDQEGTACALASVSPQDHRSLPVRAATPLLLGAGRLARALQVTGESERRQGQILVTLRTNLWTRRGHSVLHCGVHG